MGCMSLLLLYCAVERSPAVGSASNMAGCLHQPYPHVGPGNTNSWVRFPKSETKGLCFLWCRCTLEVTSALVSVPVSVRTSVSRATLTSRTPMCFLDSFLLSELGTELYAYFRGHWSSRAQHYHPDRERALYFF